MPDSLTASSDQGLRGLGGDGSSTVLGWRAGPVGGEGGAEIGTSSNSAGGEGCGGGCIATLAPTSASATGLGEGPEEELEGDKGPSSSTELARRLASGLGARWHEGGEWLDRRSTLLRAEIASVLRLRDPGEGSSEATLLGETALAPPPCHCHRWALASLPI